MAHKMLVAYATRAGATQGVAETIAAVLRENGATVDLRAAKDVRDVLGYDAVVIGSAIYAGQWMGPAKKLVEKHQAELAKMPVAFFTVCLTMKDPTEENCKAVAAYLDPLRQMIQPVSEGAFAGAVDYKKLNFVFGAILKKMGAPEGDFRDMEAVRTWARELPGLLGAS
jgi:menaquinone-dependent protoporphyrinogen oxidase